MRRKGGILFWSFGGHNYSNYFGNLKYLDAGDT